jgi:hypothetical protein
VRWSTLLAEERGDEGAEADNKSRAEWAGVWRLSREEERTTSLLDRRRDEKMHGAAAACVTRGGDMAAGQQR